MGLEKAKILLVGPFPPPYGGVANITSQLAASSLKDQWTLLPLNINLPDEVTEVVSEWRGINLRKAVVLFWRLARILRKERPHIGLIKMSGDISFLRQWLVGLIVRMSGARSIVYFHGTYKSGWRYFPFMEEKRDSRVGRFLINACFASFHRVIFLSDSIRHQFFPVLSAANRAKSTWVENFIPVREFLPVEKEEGPCTVLFVGRLSKAKGFFDLLAVIPEVLERYPDTVFSVCGTSERDDALEPVRDWLRALEQRGSICFHGLVAGAAKQQAFARADILVFPSHVEIFPVTILEGMAQGLAIVASRVGVVETVIEEPANGFLTDAGNREQLRDGILWLIEHPRERKAIGQRNRIKAIQRFDVEVSVKRLKAVIADELGKSVHSSQAAVDRNDSLVS